MAGVYLNSVKLFQRMAERVKEEHPGYAALNAIHDVVVKEEDTVKIVRCNECQYAHLDDDGTVKRCDAFGIDNWYESSDFFCGYGKER